MPIANGKCEQCGEGCYAHSRRNVAEGKVLCRDCRYGMKKPLSQQYVAVKIPEKVDIYAPHLAARTPDVVVSDESQSLTCMNCGSVYEIYSKVFLKLKRCVLCAD